jgi:hypothetical protein
MRRGADCCKVLLDGVSNEELARSQEVLQRASTKDKGKMLVALPEIVG